MLVLKTLARTWNLFFYLIYKLLLLQTTDNMNAKSLILPCILLLFSLFAGAQINYEIPEKSWQEPFGNHRAVLEISKASKVVRLNLPWRRHDLNPADRKFMIIHASTGDTIPNIYRYEIDQEKCSIAFGPVEKAGAYYFYYLPYRPVYDN